MKTTIRKGVFETNSSSVHTIAIDAPNDNMQMTCDHTVVLGNGEYNWGPDYYDTIDARIDYLYQGILCSLGIEVNEPKRDGRDGYDGYYCRYSFNDDIDFKLKNFNERIAWLKAFLDKHGIRYVMPDKARVEESSYEYNGETHVYKCIRFYNEADSTVTYNGYIDHGDRCIDMILALMSDESLLERYVFGNTVIFEYNDNTDDEDDTYVNEISAAEMNGATIFIKGN